MTKEPTERKVYFIGPESCVYHKDRDCPALNNPLRFYRISVGRLQQDGTIKVRIGRPYHGRRPCKRCSTEKSK